MTATVPARQLARSVTQADRELAKRLAGNLAEIHSTIAGWDRLILAAVIGAGYRGDGFSPRGEGGRGSGISDPTAGQMSSVADALERGAQLFGGQLGYPGEWPRMLDYIRTVDRHMRELARTTPTEAPKADECNAGLHMPGYESWGRKDAQGAPIKCDEVPDVNPETGQARRGGLCTGCYYRSYKWQRDHQSNMAAR